MAKGSKFIWFILYLIFGLYLINMSFSFFSVPEFITLIERWIILIAGVLVVLGGFNHFRASRDSGY